MSQRPKTDQRRAKDASITDRMTILHNDECVEADATRCMYVLHAGNGAMPNVEARVNMVGITTYFGAPWLVAEAL